MLEAINLKKSYNGKEALREVSIALGPAPLPSCRPIARAHWGIENSLNWVLDVTMNEDQQRITAPKTSPS